MSLELDKLLSRPHKSSHESKLSQVRRVILTDGLPDTQNQEQRPALWKLLLRLSPSLGPADYYALVQREPSFAYDKIRNDTFRTLATDVEFRQKVGEERLVRLLDAFVWRNESTSMGFTYVQGMNVLAAPFLYTLPSELEAFHCFCSFIEHSCPLYVQPTLEGVHRGLKLVDRCLETVDPELYAFLRSKNLQAEIYAFPSVLTFCACTPPLSQVLHLWDFLLAYGVHMNILCVVAQLFLMRDDLLSSKSPMALLRNMPPLQARQCIMLACGFLADIPEQLYDTLARHPYDEGLVLE